MKISINEKHAAESVGDMLQAARWVQHLNGEDIETILTEAVEKAFEIAGFDNQKLSLFMDMIDEVSDELVFLHDNLLNPVNRIERNKR